MAAMHGSKGQEELYSSFPEPVPDYDNDTSEDGSDFPPPPPPLTAEQLSEAVAQAHEVHLANGDVVAASEGSGTEGGEIRPKPLVNPCLESRERQALHKELKMNRKMGKEVLQKPELTKVLQQRRESQKKKEWEENKANLDRNSLEFKLQERANKMKEDEEKTMKVIQETEQAPEFLRMHRKITHTKPGEEPQS